MASKGSDAVLRLVLLGKTGAGKSSTGNTILGHNAFQIDNSFSSCSQQSEAREGTMPNGVTVKVIDTPGLDDRDNQEIAKGILDANMTYKTNVSDESSLGGILAFIFVIRLGRFSQEDYDCFQRAKHIFGDIGKVCIILFTHGDRLKSTGNSLSELIETAPPGLIKVLAECGNRFVVFDNTVTDPQQVKDLVENVNQLAEEQTLLSELSPFMASLLRKGDVGCDLDENLTERLNNANKSEIERQRLMIKHLQVDTAIDNFEKQMEDLRRKLQELREVQEQLRQGMMKEATDVERMRQQAVHISKGKHEY